MKSVYFEQLKCTFILKFSIAKGYLPEERPVHVWRHGVDWVQDFRQGLRLLPAEIREEDAEQTDPHRDAEQVGTPRRRQVKTLWNNMLSRYSTRDEKSSLMSKTDGSSGRGY